MDFFEGSIFSPRLHLFDQSKNSNIVKRYLKFKELFSIVIYLKIQLFIPVMAKLNFQHQYSSLQCHMILQKSNMRIC